MKLRTIACAAALTVLAAPGLGEPSAPRTGFGKALPQTRPIATPTPSPDARRIDRKGSKVDPGLAGRAPSPSLKIDPEVARRLEPAERAPQLDAVETAYDEFKSARRAYTRAGYAYRSRIGYCSRQSYTASEQRQAGCQASDTVAECSQKLLNQCSQQWRRDYLGARLGLVRKAGALRRVVDEVTRFGS